MNVSVLVNLIHMCRLCQVARWSRLWPHCHMQGLVTATTTNPSLKQVSRPCRTGSYNTTRRAQHLAFCKAGGLLLRVHLHGQLACRVRNNPMLSRH